MTSKTTNKFSTEVRARAVRMVLDHESEHPSRWTAVSSIAAKIGCSAPVWKIKDAWSSKAEKLHGISLANLLVHGQTPASVAMFMNQELEGRELFSDELPYDERWLGQLFEAAAVRPAFTISRIPVQSLFERLAREKGMEQQQFQLVHRPNRMQQADRPHLIG